MAHDFSDSGSRQLVCHVSRAGLQVEPCVLILRIFWVCLLDMELSGTCGLGVRNWALIHIETSVGSDHIFVIDLLEPMYHGHFCQGRQRIDMDNLYWRSVGWPPLIGHLWICKKR